MITVKFFGGAKKVFATQSLSLELENITVSQLLTLLKKKKPENTEPFDIDNILIAVNGADTSAINGRDTQIHAGDIISIIPVIHGGDLNCFNIGKTDVTIYPASGKKDLDHRFLDSLRCRYPKIMIQAISAKFILNRSHIKKIISLSLESKKRSILLSDKLEIDILLRFAGTNQITRAISDLGIKPKKDFVIIALGSKPMLKKFQKDLSDKIDIKKIGSNEAYIKKYFGISKKQIDAVSSKTPLEDILQEQSAVLIR